MQHKKYISAIKKNIETDKSVIGLYHHRPALYSSLMTIYALSASYEGWNNSQHDSSELKQTSSSLPFFRLCWSFLTFSCPPSLLILLYPVHSPVWSPSILLFLHLWAFDKSSKDYNQQRLQFWLHRSRVAGFFHCGMVFLDVASCPPMECPSPGAKSDHIHPWGTCLFQKDFDSD